MLTMYKRTVCPLIVQQQANVPRIIIAAPVPINTLGAVAENSVDISINLYNSTSIHIPIANIIMPDICKRNIIDQLNLIKINKLIQ